MARGGGGEGRGGGGGGRRKGPGGEEGGGRRWSPWEAAAIGKQVCFFFLFFISILFSGSLQLLSVTVSQSERGETADYS